MNYSGMLKKELVQECKRLCIDSRGNKPDLIKRLEEEAKNEYEYEFITNHYDECSAPPKGDDIYWRCKICDTAIPSLPHLDVSCACRQLSIDLGYCRWWVTDLKQFEVVRRTRKKR